MRATFTIFKTRTCETLYEHERLDPTSSGQ